MTTTEDKPRSLAAQAGDIARPVEELAPVAIERPDTGGRSMAAAAGDAAAGAAGDAPADTDDGEYEDWNVTELKDRATELEIEGRSSMNKAELIAAIREAEG